MTLLLLVVYITFISLGLPDSLLGSAWPIIHTVLNVPIEYAGVLSFVTCLCTVLSSLAAMWLNKTLGTGKTIAISTLMTSIALFGYSISPTFLLLIPFSIVLGLGAGAIDSALNNYVALNYEAKHMSFLHAFWGLGATLGPLILSIGLKSDNFQFGYRVIAGIQLILSIIQFSFVKNFDKTEDHRRLSTDKSESVKNTIEGNSRDWTASLAMLSFFFYCAAETSMFIWISTYSVNYLLFDAAIGAQIASLFFVGITSGRIISGMVSDKIGTVRMIYLSTMISAIGSLVLFFNINAYISVFGILLIGFGFASIYPSMIHRTPRRFGSKSSSKIIGYQMASAYVGSAIAPPILGVVMQKIGYNSLSILVLFSSLIIFVLTNIIEVKKIN